MHVLGQWESRGAKANKARKETRESRASRVNRASGETTEDKEIKAPRETEDCRAYRGSMVPEDSREPQAPKASREKPVNKAPRETVVSQDNKEHRGREEQQGRRADREHKALHRLPQRLRLPLPLFLVGRRRAIGIGMPIGRWDYRPLSKTSRLHRVSMRTPMMCKWRFFDSDPQQTSHLYFALACIGPTQAGYIVPYGDMPDGVDTYTIGIWDDVAGRFASGAFTGDANITDDDSSVYIQNRATLALALDMLRRAVSGELSSGQVFYAGLSLTQGPGLGAEFDPTGLNDALAYLECF